MGFRGGRGEEGGSGLGSARACGRHCRGRGHSHAATERGFFGHFGNWGRAAATSSGSRELTPEPKLRVGLGAGRGVNRLGCDGGRGRGEKSALGLASV